MAYLNAQEREALRSELKDLKFGRAKAKLHLMDPNARLVFLRNSQSVGKWSTRFELPNLGARVTLIEDQAVSTRDNKLKSDFTFVDVKVDPTPSNRT